MNTSARDLTGMRFGMLTALEPTNKRDKQRSIVWMVRCDCGNTVERSGRGMIKGKIRTCGCRGTTKLPAGVASANKLYYQYRRMATSRGYEFDIDPEYFFLLTKQDCFYCGVGPSMEIYNAPGTNGAYIYNGVDRVDNSIGYVNSNVVPCCKDCNSKKNSVTRQMAEKMIEFFNKVIQR